MAIVTHIGGFMTSGNQTVFAQEEAKFRGKTKTKRQTGEGSLGPSITPLIKGDKLTTMMLHEGLVSMCANQHPYSSLHSAVAVLGHGQLVLDGTPLPT